MAILKRTSVVDQTVDHIRQQILAGRWKKKLPGLGKLAVELDVGINTLRIALDILIENGWLSRLNERSACIIAPREEVLSAPKKFRIGILIKCPLEGLTEKVRIDFTRLVEEARSDGHDCFIVGIPRNKNRQKTGFLTQLVKDNPADAWLVCEGTLEILCWFEANGIPTLASGGRSTEVNLPCINLLGIEEGLRTSMRQLVLHGHTRIVMITYYGALHPTFGPMVQVFRDELVRAGIKPGDYHLPEWDETPVGLNRLMDSLFKVTPPTALICWARASVVGVVSWLMSHGLKIPKDVSIVSASDESSLQWLAPDLKLVCIMNEDATEWIGAIREWMRAVSTGNAKGRNFDSGTKLSNGNTIGPAKL